ncbi:MAG TPA: hypothetical protein DEA22_02030 [Blastocatellia bacterium]|nr:hypothetical protein [Blastocatellia bacterium]
MELLIPGLLLVALMVYLSTKIKKKAAKAYEREMFVGKGFSVIKPEGFISPTDIGELAFAAYSKEFGSDECENLRRVSAEARIFYGETLEDVVHQRLGTSSKTGEAKPFDNKVRIIEREEEAEGCAYSAIYKFIEGEKTATYELAIKFLPDQKDEFLQKINEMLDTFILEG